MRRDAAAQQLLRHPACEETTAVEARPCGRPATDVDHIVPKVYGGGDDASNLQSLCAGHHRQKTVTHDRRWGLHPDSPGVATPTAAPR